MDIFVNLQILLFDKDYLSVIEKRVQFVKSTSSLKDVPDNFCSFVMSPLILKTNIDLANDHGLS